MKKTNKKAEVKSTKKTAKTVKTVSKKATVKKTSTKKSSKKPEQVKPSGKAKVVDGLVVVSPQDEKVDTVVEKSAGVPTIQADKSLN